MLHVYHKTIIYNCWKKTSLTSASYTHHGFTFNKALLKICFIELLYLLWGGIIKHFFIELSVMGLNYQRCVWFNCLLWSRTIKYLFYWTVCYGAELLNICFIELFVMGPNYQRCVWLNCYIWSQTTKDVFDWIFCYGAELSNMCLI